MATKWEKAVIFLTILNVACATIGIITFYKISVEDAEIIYIQNNVTEINEVTITQNYTVNNTVEQEIESPVLEYILGGGRETGAFECVSWGSAICDEYDNLKCLNNTEKWTVEPSLDGSKRGKHLCVKNQTIRIFFQ